MVLLNLLGVRVANLTSRILANLQVGERIEQSLLSEHREDGGLLVVNLFFKLTRNMFRGSPLAIKKRIEVFLNSSSGSDRPVWPRHRKEEVGTLARSLRFNPDAPPVTLNDLEAQS